MIWLVATMYRTAYRALENPAAFSLHRNVAGLSKVTVPAASETVQVPAEIPPAVYPVPDTSVRDVTRLLPLGLVAEVYRPILTLSAPSREVWEPPVMRSSMNVSLICHAI